MRGRYYFLNDFNFIHRICSQINLSCLHLFMAKPQRYFTQITSCSIEHHRTGMSQHMWRNMFLIQRHTMFCGNCCVFIKQIRSIGGIKVSSPYRRVEPNDHRWMERRVGKAKRAHHVQGTLRFAHLAFEFSG